FYSAEGGPAVPAVVSTTAEAAGIAHVHWQLNPSSGLLLARPPAGGPDIQPIRAQALPRGRPGGGTRPAATPPGPPPAQEPGGGRGVEVNQRLIADNAALAAEVAVAYASRAAA